MTGIEEKMVEMINVSLGHGALSIAKKQVEILKDYSGKEWEITPEGVKEIIKNPKRDWKSKIHESKCGIYYVLNSKSEIEEISADWVRVHRGVPYEGTVTNCHAQVIGTTTYWRDGVGDYIDHKDLAHDNFYDYDGYRLYTFPRGRGANKKTYCFILFDAE